jgi:hypothetical protein
MLRCGSVLLCYTRSHHRFKWHTWFLLVSFLLWTVVVEVVACAGLCYIAPAEAPRVGLHVLCYLPKRCCRVSRSVRSEHAEGFFFLAGSGLGGCFFSARGGVDGGLPSAMFFSGRRMLTCGRILGVSGEGSCPIISSGTAIRCRETCSRGGGDHTGLYWPDTKYAPPPKTFTHSGKPTETVVAVLPVLVGAGLSIFDRE